jgi:serine/tyrosine/threonine adenylyltransferase
LLTSEETDEADIINDLLTRMQNQSLDFHITFRTLCSFSPSAFLEEGKRDDKTYRQKFIEKLVPAPTSSSSKMSLQDSEVLLESSRKEMGIWFEKYAQRVMNEKEVWAQRLSATSENTNNDAWEKERETYMRGFNPRFVLRQWVLEEVIKKCGRDPYKGKRILAKVMEVCIIQSRSRDFGDDHLLDGY